MSSAIEFVEGGVQDACEDACSICLDAFSDQDPASVTQCNHEYHLQCILEWSQRSAGCPMCWQPLILQDASSQELLSAMELERSLRQHRIQRASLLPRFRSGDYELHQLPGSFEEHILQHFAAAVGQSRGLGREGHSLSRSHVSGRRPSQFLVFPPHSPAASSGTFSDNKSTSARSFSNFSVSDGQPEVGILYVQESGASTGALNVPRDGVGTVQSPSARQISSESASTSHYDASTSDFHSFPETFKSRLATVSSRYKESLTKTTRIFRERLRAKTGVPIDTNVGEESPSIMQNTREISMANLQQMEDADVPHSNLAAMQPEVSDTTSTDINPVHTSIGENNGHANLKDEHSTNTSSQVVGDDTAGDCEVVPVRSSNEVAEHLCKDKSTLWTI